MSALICFCKLWLIFFAMDFLFIWFLLLNAGVSDYWQCYDFKTLLVLVYLSSDSSYFIVQQLAAVKLLNCKTIVLIRLQFISNAGTSMIFSSWIPYLISKHTINYEWKEAQGRMFVDILPCKNGNFKVLAIWYRCH